MFFKPNTHRSPAGAFIDGSLRRRDFACCFQIRLINLANFGADVDFGNAFLKAAST